MTAKLLSSILHFLNDICLRNEKPIDTCKESLPCFLAVQAHMWTLMGKTVSTS